MSRVFSAESDPNDRRFMLRALKLARVGIGVASPNPTVGCVVVHEGKIVGEGYHSYDARDHAEVIALRTAGALSRGATVYVTLEPCAHQGRTPPCVDLLVKAGIRRVVAASVDPNPLVNGRGLSRLSAAGIRVESGLMQLRADELLEPFACHITHRVPLVVAKVGMSLDGKIAPVRGAGGWITCPEARALGQSLRHRLDAILVGIGTVLADDPELTYRGTLIRRRPLVRVILDRRLRTPDEARLFRADPPAPVLIFCAQNAQAKKRILLESCGAEIMPAPVDCFGLDLAYILRELGKRDLLSVLVEGGSEIHWSFLSNQLVDKFYFIIAACVLGGIDAVPAVGGHGYKTVSDAPRFRIRKTSRIASDVVIEAFPQFSKSILSPWRPPA